MPSPLGPPAAESGDPEPADDQRGAANQHHKCDYSQRLLFEIYLPEEAPHVDHQADHLPVEASVRQPRGLRVDQLS